MDVMSAAARIVILVALSAVALASGARAQADFAGKTLTIIASFEAGGPYDFYARLIARHLGAHLPGTPNVIVQNMPGAGGLRGANYLYNVAAQGRHRDGRGFADCRGGAGARHHARHPIRRATNTPGSAA